jgi:hypothetical protein
MELLEEIRREYRLGAGTIQGVVKKLKTHRRRVRRAVREFVDGFLQSDQAGPLKQRHTAHRIWERIGREHLD